jgi:hypothetical protein
MNTASRPPFRLRWAALPLVLALAGCDVMGILGIETAAQLAEQKEAEGKAIGSGCRHAERSIEECYQNNTRASKAAVFAGWREMDEYMRENKIASMPPKAKPAMIDETADGEPSGRAGATQNARAGSTAATSAVRPTSAGSGAIPSIRPVLPAPSGAATPARPASSGTATPRPATAPTQRSN